VQLFLPELLLQTLLARICHTAPIKNSAGLGTQVNTSNQN
jgi:hypothetical protein